MLGKYQLSGPLPSYHCHHHYNHHKCSIPKGRLRPDFKGTSRPSQGSGLGGDILESQSQLHVAFGSDLPLLSLTLHGYNKGFGVQWPPISCLETGGRPGHMRIIWKLVTSVDFLVPSPPEMLIGKSGKTWEPRFFLGLSWLSTHFTCNWGITTAWASQPQLILEA